MNGRSKFESFISSCMDNRIEELSNEYSNSAEYSKFCYLYNHIFNQIREVLPSESLELIDRLDCLQGSYLAVYQKFFYEQGFQTAECYLTCFKNNMLTHHSSQLKFG